MSEKFTPVNGANILETVKPTGEDQTVLIRRSQQEGETVRRIETMRLSSYVDENGRRWAYQVEKDENGNEKVIAAKPIAEAGLTDEAQAALAEELALDRPGLTAEQWDRGVSPEVQTSIEVSEHEPIPEEVIEEIGEEAVEAAGIEEPLPEVEESVLEEAAVEAPQTEEVAEDGESSDAALEGVKREYDRQVELVVETMQDEARASLSAIENQAHEIDARVQSLAYMEQSADSLQKLLSNIDNGNYTIEMARTSLRNIAEQELYPFMGASAALSADAYLEITRGLGRLNETVEDASYQLRVKQAAYRQVREQMLEGQEDSASIEADRTSEISGALSALQQECSELSQQMPALQEKGQGVHLALRKQAARIDMVIQESYSGRIDEDEIRATIVELRELAEQRSELTVASKLEEFIGRTRQVLQQSAQ